MNLNRMGTMEKCFHTIKTPFSKIYSDGHGEIFDKKEKQGILIMKI